MGERKIIRHKHIGDQYLHLLEMGRKITPTERLISLFQMQEEYRQIHNEPTKKTQRTIIIKKPTWI
ncbi:hypothetical protein [Emticicia sp. SJ17W-69]|uniref:hypothetical protein n=1 Tax=Emticicia sp. SJ17W-69 TaxID=3421657 RepID=UPI003EC1378E